MEPDFSGWATKYNKKCSDGLTILPDAFKHDDKIKVPLVWRHDDTSPTNVLGHAILEHKAGQGVYTQGFFNSSAGADSSRELLKHEDINTMSIHAGQVVKRGTDVIHGKIKEVSLVVAGANPEAIIENVYIKHGDGVEVIDDELIIHSGEEIKHGDQKAEIEHEDDEDSSSDSEETVGDIYNTLTPKQKQAVNFMIGSAAEGTLDDDDDNDEEDEEDVEQNDDDPNNIKHGGNEMKRNVFENAGGDLKHGDIGSLGPDKVTTIMHDAEGRGSLAKTIAHGDYGVQNLELLFPDAKAIETHPEFIKRRTEWVSGVLSGVRSLPWTRVKSLHADLTADEARALGYIKSTQKVDEVFPIMTRSTGPRTIYKKQRLDRDDIIDVTDFDIVVWIKAEMRAMLEEEIARAILIGDGRPVDSPDKIRDPMGAASGEGIRSIFHDSDFYAEQIQVESDLTGEALVEHIARKRPTYKGSGTPKFYTTEEVLADMLFARDAEGRRYYNSVDEVARALRVSEIIPVEVFDTETALVGILVNLADYSLGTDKGGQTAFFDDFDIDFNQYKYLYETRLSGALTKYKSAQVFRTDASVSGNLPSIDGTDPSGAASVETRKQGYETGEAAARERGYKGKPLPGND